MQKKLCFLYLGGNHVAKKGEKKLLVLNGRGNIMSVFMFVFPKTVRHLMIEKRIVKLIQKSNDDKMEDKNKNEIEEKDVMSTEIATFNLFQQGFVLLQTTQARLETPACKRSKYLRIFFNTGSEVSLITPRGKCLLNLVAKGSKQFSVTSFGYNEMKQELENLDIV